MKHKETLFTPGEGMLPPHLAGRTDERAYLDEALHALKLRQPPVKNIVMTGPRGAGKTALLRHFKRMAEGVVDVLWTTPNKLEDVGHLASLMVPEPLWKRIQNRLSDIGIPGVAHFQMVRGEPGVNRATDLQEAAILERSRARPLALVVDEAHVLDLKIGQGILNAAQFVRGNGGALLLVLAGTPNLIGRLNQMEASFWSRCKQMGIGRLAPAESLEALQVPLNKAGIDADTEALSPALQEAQDYPYFIQELGDAIWRLLPPDEGYGLRLRDVQAALPTFKKTQTAYYETRRRELRARGLTAAAQSVAAAFQGRKRLSDDEVQDALRSTPSNMESTSAQQRTTALSDLGFIWEHPERAGWEPGIPSLMDYMLAQGRSAHH